MSSQSHGLCVASDDVWQQPFIVERSTLQKNAQVDVWLPIDVNLAQILKSRVKNNLAVKRTYFSNFTAPTNLAINNFFKKN